MVLKPEIAGIPLLGLLATLGLLIAVFSGDSNALSVSGMASSSSREMFRPELVAGLLLPQIFLTLANSVLATKNVSERYFGESASRVTVKRLLYSIGIGNLLAAGVGGMPFCHGSGGVTAHVRGGSTRAWSTALMGGCLLILAGVQYFSGSRVLIYPAVLLVPLLIATGVFHIFLAAPTARLAPGMMKLATAVLITLVTRNLLWVTGSAIFLEFLFNYLPEKFSRISLQEERS